MLVVMSPEATEDQVQAVIDRIESVGGTAHPSRGAELTLIGAIGDADTELRVSELELGALAGVSKIVPILKPYKLAALEARHGNPSVFDIGGAKIGGDNFALIAGPCTVESRDQLLDTAALVKSCGASMLRGGAYKPRTSPYSFQGLGVEGLNLLAEAREQSGLPIVTELMDARDIEPVLEVADLIQVGARNMQNYGLLTELGRAGRPVLLKRGLSATLEEFVMAAEYILKEGNEQVILCERGIRTFETAYRFTLDLMAVPVLKEMTHLPIVVDPSHGTGHTPLVPALARASVAAGADGIIVEVHPNPEKALSDGYQSMNFKQFEDMMTGCRRVAEAMDMKM